MAVVMAVARAAVARAMAVARAASSGAGGDGGGCDGGGEGGEGGALSKRALTRVKRPRALHSPEESTCCWALVFALRRNIGSLCSAGQCARQCTPLHAGGLASATLRGGGESSRSEPLHESGNG